MEVGIGVRKEKRRREILVDKYNPFTDRERMRFS